MTLRESTEARTLTRPDRDETLQRLERLKPDSFEAVIERMEVPLATIPGPKSSRAVRADELLKWVERAHDEHRWSELLAALDVVARVHRGGLVMRIQIDDPLPGLLTQRAEQKLAGKGTRKLDERIDAIRRERRQGPALQPGEHLGDDGRYRLLREIGRGATGTVWEGHDQVLHCKVAVKVLNPQWTQDEYRVERFDRVVQQMARLAHPGIVGIVAKHQSWQGFHYFVMEYLDGGDLRRAVLDKAVAPEKIPGILRRAGEALAWLHGQGLVHRSARPANIVLAGEGDVRLTDVDMQRVVDATHTPRPADPRADLALFATTALFALSGRRPSREMLQDPHRAVSDLPCSDALKGVLRRAFDPDTSKRTPTVAAFCDEFALASPPEVPVATAAETAREEVAPKRARGGRVALLVLLLVVLTVVGVLVARR